MTLQDIGIRSHTPSTLNIPAEVDVSGEVSSQPDRAELRRVRRRQSREDTPWDSTKHLAQEKGDLVRGECHKDDRGEHTDHVDEHDIAVTEAVDLPATENEADCVHERSANVTSQQRNLVTHKKNQWWQLGRWRLATER
jgi:hypothetical protein